MNKFLMSGLVLSAMIGTTAYAKPAAQNNVSATLGYQNDQVVETEGAFLEGSVTKNNLRIGLNTLIDDKANMVNYGANVGVPLQLFNTKLVLTPNVGVTHYRDANVNNAAVRLDLDYPVFKTVTVGAKASYSKTINKKDNKDLDGAAYTIGITKLF